MVRCPICGEKLVREPITCVQGHLAEEYAHCPKEHYSYNYAYGGTQFWIGDKCFGFHYLDDLETRRKIRKKIDETIKEMILERDVTKI